MDKGKQEEESGGGGGSSAPQEGALHTRISEIREVLFGSYPAPLDNASLERLVFYGIPHPGLRACAWMVLLGYLPSDGGIGRPDSPREWEAALLQRRKDYWGFVEEFALPSRPRWSRSKSAIPAVDPTDPTTDPTNPTDPTIANAERETEPRSETETSSSTTPTTDDSWPPHRNIDPEDPNYDDREIARRVYNDVVRTCPETPFFQDPEDDTRGQDKVLQRMLYTYAKLNAGIGYVQGMSELIAVLYYAFSKGAGEGSEHGSELEALVCADPEADAFWCLTELFSIIRDNFNKVMDSTDEGIMHEMIHMNNVLKVNDESLWAALEEKGVDHRFYSFRWLTLLLSQEFPLDSVLRLWDSLFADPYRFTHKWFIHHFGVAMLISLRESIFELEFNQIVPLLQAFPAEHTVESIFPLALAVRKGRYAAPDAANHQRLMEGMLYHRVSADDWVLQFFLLKRSRAAPHLQLIRYDSDARFSHVSSLTLTRYTVRDIDVRDGATLLAGFHIFVLVQGGKQFFFAATTQEIKWRWMAALSRAGSQSLLGTDVPETSAPAVTGSSTPMVDYIDTAAYDNLDLNSLIPIDEQIHKNVATANDWIQLAQNNPTRISVTPQKPQR